MTTLSMMMSHRLIGDKVTIDIHFLQQLILSSKGVVIMMLFREENLFNGKSNGESCNSIFDKSQEDPALVMSRSKDIWIIDPSIVSEPGVTKASGFEPFLNRCQFWNCVHQMIPFVSPRNPDPWWQTLPTRILEPLRIMSRELVPILRPLFLEHVRAPRYTAFITQLPWLALTFVNLRWSMVIIVSTHNNDCGQKSDLKPMIRQEQQGDFNRGGEGVLNASFQFFPNANKHTSLCQSSVPRFSVPRFPVRRSWSPVLE